MGFISVAGFSTSDGTGAGDGEGVARTRSVFTGVEVGWPGWVACGVTLKVMKYGIKKDEGLVWTNWVGAALRAVALGVVVVGSFGGELRAADPVKQERSQERGSEFTAKAVPYQGKVVAVNASAQTFTLTGRKERLFQMMPGTVVTKDDAPAKFEQLAVGDLVRGLAIKNGDYWEAKKVYIGPKATASAGKPGEKAGGQRLAAEGESAR